MNEKYVVQKSRSLEPYVIHVWAPALEQFRKDLEAGLATPFPTVAVRKNARSPKFWLVEQVTGISHSRMVRLEQALPGTGGRAICVLEVQSPFAMKHYGTLRQYDLTDYAAVSNILTSIRRDIDVPCRC